MFEGMVMTKTLSRRRDSARLPVYSKASSSSEAQQARDVDLQDVASAPQPRALSQHSPISSEGVRAALSRKVRDLARSDLQGHDDAARWPGLRRLSSIPLLLLIIVM